MNTVDNDKLYSQWVSNVLRYSTQYDASGGWPATNVIGESNTYPAYGDLHTAWAPAKSKGCDEFLELEYETPVFVKGISIYETYHPGAVVRVSSMNPAGHWEVIYQGEPHQDKLPEESRIFEPQLDVKPYLTRVIRIDLDTRLNKSWSEIDAIHLHGTLPEFRLSNSMCAHYQSLLDSELFSDFQFEHLELNNGDGLGSNILDSPISPQPIRRYNLHRVILRNRCPMLYQAMTEERLDTLSYLSSRAMRLLLNFIYTERIELSEEDLSSAVFLFDQLSRAANEYSIRRLKAICESVKKYGVQNYDLLCLAEPTTFVEDMRCALTESSNLDTFQPDVVFVFETEDQVVEIYAHKAIICSRSAYFMAMLTRWVSEEEEESSESKLIRIPLEDSDTITFQSLLEYIYTGSTEISASNAVMLLMSGKQYLLEDFEEPVLNIIRQSIDVDNVIDLLFMANDMSIMEVIHICGEYLRDCYESVPQDVLFNLNEEWKQQLISCVPELKPILYSEKKLKAISQWVHKVLSASNMDNHATLIGECTVFPPRIGTSSNCWSTYGLSQITEYLELKFMVPVLVTGIDIYEVLHPGAVTKIQIMNEDKNWDTVYCRPGPYSQGIEICRIFKPPLELRSYRTDSVRVEFGGVPKTVIGSVQLHGLFC